MPNAITPSKPQRGRSRRKLNPDIVVAMADQGIPKSTIARSQGVSHTQIGRFLESIGHERQALVRFKAERADVLATLHGKALAVKEKIIESLLKDTVIDTLEPGQKANLLRAVNESGGTDYDKERLERGLSTQNESVLLRVISSAQKELYQPAQLRKPEPVDSGSGPTTGSGSPLVENGDNGSETRNAVPDAEIVK